VIANDNTLWTLGLDETKSEMINDRFIPVMEPDNSSNLDSKNKENKEDNNNKSSENMKIFNCTNCIVRKGYYGVSVISSCQQKLYDIVITSGIARLVEVEVYSDSYREKYPELCRGNIIDISNGFRHSLIIVDDV
jgi:hypothetical protein